MRPAMLCWSVTVTGSTGWSRCGSIGGWPLASTRPTWCKRPSPSRPGIWMVICASRRSLFWGGSGIWRPSKSSMPIVTTLSHGAGASIARPGRRNSGMIRWGCSSAGSLPTTPARAIDSCGAERIERVTRALEALEPVDRDVLAMRYLEQLGAMEIAEALGIREGAVKSRIFRALDRLRRQMEADA